jgi:UDP-2,3-diacylglucosamine hydrolase
MFHKQLKIQEGALIISDAHYSPSRPELFFLIEEIFLEKRVIPQLILMGDIFDNLFGGISYTYKANQTLIDMLNAISLKIDVIYLEGNHDFQLHKIFQNMTIVPINMQPIMLSYQEKKILLAHGDFDGAVGYKIYTALIRNPFVLLILKFIDNLTRHSIINFVDKHLEKKDDCNEFSGFEKFIQNRIINKYSCDYFIEGHYHQNKRYRWKDLNYINLAAFACNQRYFIVKSIQDNELLEEKSFSKGI